MASRPWVAGISVIWLTVQWVLRKGTGLASFHTRQPSWPRCHVLVLFFFSRAINSYRSSGSSARLGRQVPQERMPNSSR